MTGTVALLAAAKPTATVAEIRSAILGSVDKAAALAGKVGTGGRVNAFAAMQRLTSGAAAATPTPAPAPTRAPAPTPAPVPAPAVLTKLYADEFNRLNVPSLPAPWQTLSGAFSVTANQVVSRSAGTSLAVVGGVSAADVVVRSTVTLGTASSVGLVVRQTTSGMYYATLSRTAAGVVARIWLQRGNVTALLGTTSAAAAAGVLEFSAIGTRLTLSLGGKSLLAVTDTAIRTAGGVGYRFSGVGGTADSFSAHRRG